MNQKNQFKIFEIMYINQKLIKCPLQAKSKDIQESYGFRKPKNVCFF